jgi:hypothetical protein
MNNRIPITASEGMILTNGEIYGTTIYLAEGVDASTFYQIPIEEYNRILEEQRQKELYIHGT